jgi:hypothetical protein
VVQTAVPASSGPGRSKADGNGVSGVKLAFGSVVSKPETAQAPSAARKRAGKAIEPPSAVMMGGEETEREERQRRGRGGYVRETSRDEEPQSLLPALFPASMPSTEVGDNRREGGGTKEDGKGTHRCAEAQQRMLILALNLLRHLIWRSAAAVQDCLELDAPAIISRLLPSAAAVGAPPDALHELLGLMANLLGCQETATALAAAANGDAPHPRQQSGQRVPSASTPIIFQLLHLARFPPPLLTHSLIQSMPPPLSIRTHACIHTHTHTHTSLYSHIVMYTYIHAYRQTDGQTDMHACMHTVIQLTMQSYILIHIEANTQHTHTHTQIYA